MMSLFKKKNKEVVTQHWGNEYLWVKKVIESCKTSQQVSNSRRLIDLLVKKHEEYDWTLTNKISRELTMLADDLQEDLFKKEIYGL
jgi:hypothetical protein